jgi:hypothetical protein
LASGGTSVTRTVLEKQPKMAQNYTHLNKTFSPTITKMTKTASKLQSLFRTVPDIIGILLEGKNFLTNLFTLFIIFFGPMPLFIKVNPQTNIKPIVHSSTATFP